MNLSIQFRFANRESILSLFFLLASEQTTNDLMVDAILKIKHVRSLRSLLKPEGFGERTRGGLLGPGRQASSAS